MSWLERTELLLGSERLNRLKNSHVLVIGLGGVGAYAAEMICRAGIGKLTLVDGDVVENTNRNRQLPALVSTMGRSKAQVLGERFRDINPEIQLTIRNEYMHDQLTVDLLESDHFDYVVDAIDTLSPKVFLIYHCLVRGIPVASSMGAGGKMDPSLVLTGDISASYGCRLARFVRKRLSRMGIKKGFQIVFSPEEVDEKVIRNEEQRNKKSTVGTISYMPPVFGCHLASIVIRELAGN